MKATEHLTTVDNRPSADSVDTALAILDDHLAQLNALSIVLEERLADLCKREPEGGGYWPLTEWRMAQVMLDMLSSTDVRKNVAWHLGQREAAAEVAHG